MPEISSGGTKSTAEKPRVQKSQSVAPAKAKERAGKPAAEERLDRKTPVPASEAPAEDKSAAVPEKKRQLSWWTLRKLKKILATRGLDKPHLAEARKIALLNIIDCDDPQVGPLVIDALQDEWIVVREAATQVLARLRDPAAVPQLCEVVARDSSVDVRKTAGHALAAIGDARGVLPLLTLGLDQPHQRTWIPEVIARMGKQATPPLVRALTHEDLGLRLDAVVALGRIRDPDATRPLVAALRGSPTMIQAEIAESLGSIGDPQGIPALTKLLGSEDSVIRAAAAAALSKVANSEATPMLLAALGDSDSTVRGFAATALGNLECIEAIDSLAQLLTDPDETVRSRVAEALGSIPDPQAVRYLVTAIKDPLPLVREKAALGLGKQADPAGVEPLIGALNDTYQNVRRQTAESLGKIGDPRATEPLSKFLAIERMVETRLSASRALGQLGDPRALGALRDALNDEFTVRCRACVAIGAIGTPAAVDILIPLLLDPVAEIRYHAAIALGNIGDSRALRPLEEMMSEQDPFVLRGVGKALQLLGDSRAEQVLERAREASAAKSAKETSFEKSSAKKQKLRQPRIGQSWREALRDLGQRLTPNTLVGGMDMADSAAKKKLGLGAGVIAASLLVIFGGISMYRSLTRIAPQMAGPNVMSVAFGHGSALVVLRTDGTLKLQELPKGTLRQTFKTDSDITLLAVSPDGGRIAAAMENHSIKVWETSTTAEIASVGHSQPVVLMQFSDDGKSLCSISKEGKVYTWDLATGKARAEFQLNMQGIEGLAVSSDTERVATGTKDGVVRIWEINGGKEWAKIPGHETAVTRLAFSHDGNLLASRSKDGIVHLWDLIARKHKDTLENPKTKSDQVTCMAFGPADKLLAIGTETGGVILWDLEKQKNRPLTAELGARGTLGLENASAVSFSSDGKLVAAAGARNEEIAVWDVTTGAMRHQVLPAN